MQMQVLAVEPVTCEFTARHVERYLRAASTMEIVSFARESLLALTEEDLTQLEAWLAEPVPDSKEAKQVQAGGLTICKCARELQKQKGKD